jgi:hypothetical protein
MNERFNFRVALKQADGIYKRYGVISLGRDARGLYARCSIPHKENEFYLHDIVIDEDNAILEQCTGLKDKRGNLIYEGDIVKGEDISWAKVIFSYGEFLLEEKTGGYADLTYYSPYIEIIGNIHEKEGE